MTEEYQPKTLKPTRTAPVRFKGRIIAEMKWGTGKFHPDGKECWMRFRVWETRSGAYITEIGGDVPGKSTQVHCTVGIVEPIMDAVGERDETAMQIAVLQQFDFHDRAKAMLKRELGWSPYVVVE